MLGIDGHPLRRGFATTVFVDAHAQHDMSVRRDPWRDLQLQTRFSKLNGPQSVSVLGLIRVLRTLLDQSFHQIRSHDTRPRDDLAATAGLKRRQFDVDKPRHTGTIQRERQSRRTATAKATCG